jgi:galactokinase
VFGNIPYSSYCLTVSLSFFLPSHGLTVLQSHCPFSYRLTVLLSYTMMDSLLDRWHNTFGSNAPEVIVRAPGRVNIIGEHTDYNEGWVLPGAMSRSIYILASREPANGHHWIAYDLDEEVQSPENIFEYGEYAWAKYIEGAIRLYAPEIGSLHLLIGGDLPVGAGISSSSALVCGILYALQQLTEGDESKEDLALVGQRVEREIIGVQGGIMDQFAIMMSQPEHVMLLDCRTREYQDHQCCASGMQVDPDQHPREACTYR